MKLEVPRKIITILGAASLGATLPSMAAIIAADPFDGTNVSNGGTGWTGPWTGSANTLLASSIGTGNGVISSGTSAALGFYGDGQATRNFSATAITTGTLWMSWFQTSSAPVEEPSQIRILNGSDTRLMFGKHFGDAQTFKIFSDGGGSVQGTSTVNTVGTNFVVASMEFATGQVDLYVNPTGMGTGGAPLTGLASSWTSGTHLSAGLTGIQTVSSGSGTMSVDEFRVGTAWIDVSPIPEPSSLALVGLGLITAASLRRRQPSGH